MKTMMYFESRIIFSDEDVSMTAIDPFIIESIIQRNGFCEIITKHRIYDSNQKWQILVDKWWDCVKENSPIRYEIDQEKFDMEKFIKSGILIVKENKSE